VQLLAPGWWYVPEEIVVGRLCKRCNTFREKAEFTSNEWGRMIKAICRKCKPEERKCIKRSRAKRRKVSEKHRLMDERSSRAESASEPVGRTEYIRRLAKHTLEDRSDDNSDSEGEPGQLTRFQSTLGIKLRAADLRYITHADAYNRGDVVILVSEVRELLRLKVELSKEVAKVWLTTTDMGFSLTDEDHMVVCPKDLREGKITD
jgi:hypothetical protein